MMQQVSPEVVGNFECLSALQFRKNFPATIVLAISGVSRWMKRLLKCFEKCFSGYPQGENRPEKKVQRSRGVACFHLCKARLACVQF